jgi:DNA-binding NtrC family response regulator
MVRLATYRWPGNVRELRYVIERAMAVSEGRVLELEHLPAHVIAAEGERGSNGEGEPPANTTLTLESAALDLRLKLQEHEAFLIAEALRRSGGNQRVASDLLNIPLRTLERKLKEMRLRQL